MKQHSVERLQERFDMNRKEFYEEYNSSVEKGNYFKKDFQDPTYPSMNVCVVIRRKLMELALDKDDGTIITVMKPQFVDWQKAWDMGLDVDYPKVILEDLKKS